jgi:hypothetical protein
MSIPRYPLAWPAGWPRSVRGGKRPGNFKVTLDKAIKELGEEIARIDLLMGALASGSDRSWQPIERFGIRRIVQCHHSDDRKAVVNGAEYVIP